MLFKVSYQDEVGAAKSVYLTAPNRDSLESHPAFRVGDVSIKELPNALAPLLIKTLSLESQLLLMSQVAAAVNSGGDISGVREIILSIPELTKVDEDPRFRHASTITAYLEICNVDSVTIMLVRSGEGSGRLAEAVESAVVDIAKRIELAQAMKGDVGKGLFYVAAGFGMLIGLSKMLNDIILQLMAADRLDVNFGTHVLLFVNDAFGEYLLVTLGIVGGVSFAAYNLWFKSPSFRDIPIVKIYNNYRKVVRSLQFISTWRPLFLSGTPVMDSLTQVHDGLSGLDRAAVEALIEEIRLGKSIAQSLSKDDWSTAFRIGMKPFDKATDEWKSKLLFRIQELLQVEVATLGKKLGSIMLSIGMVAAVIGVMLMAFGFYMPMLGGMKMF